MLDQVWQVLQGAAPTAPPSGFYMLTGTGAALVAGGATVLVRRAARRLQCAVRTRRVLRMLDRMDGTAFEGYLAAFFARCGYDVRLGRVGPDYGVDCVLERGRRRIAVQIKRYRPNRTVGNAAVQAAIAGARYVGAQEAWVVTTSFFSQPARQLALKASVRLLDRWDLAAALCTPAQVVRTRQPQSRFAVASLRTKGGSPRGSRP